MAASNYMESGVLNHIFRTTTFSKPTTVTIALTNDVPTDDQTGVTINELSGGSYARVDLGAPADADWDFMDQVNGSGHIQNTAAVTFPTATANWGHASGVAICDATTGGNMLFHAALSTPRDIQNNDTFSFGIGDLDLFLG